MTGLVKRVVSDPTERKYHFVHSQDVEPILEQNKIERGLEQKHDCARKVATIPNVILLIWLYEEHRKGNTDLKYPSRRFNDEVVFKKLQDPDWAYLRTSK